MRHCGLPGGIVLRCWVLRGTPGWPVRNPVHRGHYSRSAGWSVLSQVTFSRYREAHPSVSGRSALLGLKGCGLAAAVSGCGGFRGDALIDDPAHLQCRGINRQPDLAEVRMAVLI